MDNKKPTKPEFVNPVINPNEDTRITGGSQVELHFAVALENGVQIDSTFERDAPVSLTIGDGSLLEGFEKTLMGLRAGDKRTAHLSPAEGFGDWHQDNVQRFDKNLFTDGEPQVGTMMAFEDKSKATLTGVVSDVGDDTVTVDFNHPLAGKNVVFTVEIFKVTPAGARGVRLS